MKINQGLSYDKSKSVKDFSSNLRPSTLNVVNLLMKHILSTFIFALAIVSCEPDYPPPEGYVEECYGDNFGKYLAGHSPKYHVLLNIETQQWPELRMQLEALSKQLEVVFFYEDRFPNSELFIASLCSKAGLYMHADKRIWESDREEQRQEPMSISIYAYHESFDWKPFVETVHSSLIQAWADSLILDHQIKESLQLGF